MVYPSYYKDNSFHSRNRYAYKHKNKYRNNRNNSNNINKNNHSYLNNSSTYKNDDGGNNNNSVNFHNSLSSPNLSINQPDTNISNSSSASVGGGGGNKLYRSPSLTGIKKSRYQPHIFQPLQNFRSRYNGNNSTDYSDTKITIGKSRYDPTNKTLYHSSLYEKQIDRYQISFTVSNHYYRNNHNIGNNNIINNNNNNIPLSFNQYKRLNGPTVYNKKGNTDNNNNYTKYPSRISKFSTSSSITHSYVKPQAKLTHRTCNLTITADNPSSKSTRFVFKQSTRTQNNTSISNSLNSDNNGNNNSNTENNSNANGTINKNSFSNKENSVPLPESDNDTVEDNTIYNSTYDQLNDFEHINDPYLLETKLSDLNHRHDMSSYPKDTPTFNEYMFPLNRLQNRLWFLKYRLKCEKFNGTRENKLITSLSQYPFYQKNIHNTKQVQNCMNWLLKNKYSQLKTHLTTKKYQYKTNLKWIKQCKEEEFFDAIRKQQQRQSNIRLDSDDDDGDTNDIDNDTTIFSNTLSGRTHINRADYVNDDELEDIMCQIDPGYRYNKQAAMIPIMITDTLKRNAIRFVDVNNLVVDKDKWATRLITDKIDTFTEKEHDSFIKGYLRFPKKFGKISHFMGGLRSPEECVLHYYRTKKIVDYKALIKKRNMDRIKPRCKSVKKNQDNINTDETSDGAYSPDVEAMLDEDISEIAYEEEMEEEIEEEEKMEEEDFLDSYS